MRFTWESVKHVTSVAMLETFDLKNLRRQRVLGFQT